MERMLGEAASDAECDLEGAVRRVPGWQAGVEMAEGRRDARVLDRCRAYAVADDLMWGLQGLILSATSPRRDLEFLKYGEWRLLRCRMALREPGFAARLHRL